MKEMNEKNHPNHQYKIRLTAGGKETEGIAQARLWSVEEKRNRAIAGFAITWGLAACSVFLPLAHFVLVPALLIAGPFVFLWAKKQNGKITGLEANCPFCGNALTTAETSINWPQRIACTRCSEPVRIDVVTQH